MEAVQAISLCVCICACSHVCASAFVCTDVHIHVFMWRPENNLGCHSSDVIGLGFLNRDLSLTYNCPSKPGWTLPVSTYLELGLLGLQMSSPIPSFILFYL